MSAFGEFLIEAFGDGIAEGLSSALVAVWRELRRRLTGYHVAASWIGAVGVMATAWRCGVVGKPAWYSGFLVALFIAAPIAALLFTIAWMERRGA